MIVLIYCSIVLPIDHPGANVNVDFWLIFESSAFLAQTDGVVYTVMVKLEIH